MSKFQATPVNVPSLAEITDLYKSAVDAGDERVKSAAESAVRQLAVAEAAAAEAATLVGFAHGIRQSD